MKIVGSIIMIDKDFQNGKRYLDMAIAVFGGGLEVVAVDERKYDDYVDLKAGDDIEMFVKTVCVEGAGNFHTAI